MSSAMAIASVTAVLKNLLDNGMIDDQVVSALGNVTVTARAPDLITLEPNSPSQLNLFLYQVTPNQGWRNVGLPERNGAGDRLQNPPLALDLHYFLTAYAARDLHAEILLGYGMQLLHQTPVLSRQGIRRALGVPGLVSDPDNSLPPQLEAVGASGLAEQVEGIRIVLEAIGADGVSKLWAAFQSRYRPSAAYLATVVLIEAQRSTRAALPVRARKLYVVPFHEPTIERVLAQENASTPPRADLMILARHRLVLRGRQLRSAHTSVRVGGTTVVPAAAALDDTEITVPIPSGLTAGAQSVQVVHEHLLGEPPVPHAGTLSNLLAFVLHPEIAAPPSMPAVDVVRVTLAPPVAATQTVVLLLNERLAASSPPAPPPRAHSFVAPARPIVSPPQPATQIDVPIRGVAPGDYLVRVQVDGAESPLGADPAGHFVSPSLTVP